MQVLSGPDRGLAVSAPVRGWPAGVVVALLVHGAIASVLVKVDPSWLARREPPVELEVVETPPPPPPPPPADEPPPPPPVRAPVAVHRVIAAPKMPTPPPEAPPPPNQEPPPNTPPAPPVFGVTMDSTVAGNAAMAVPVGNTVATNDRTPARAGPPPLPAGGQPTFVPVADIYIATRARILEEINGEEIYPADARRMGVSGTVELRIGIDENGEVKEAKAISVKPPGYQFDDAAVAAIRKAKFAPARSSDGKAVASRITWTYRFSLPQ